MAWIAASSGAWAQSNLTTIGVTQLRAMDPTLTGSGVSVAQPEAMVGPGAFEVNPSTVSQPASLFTYSSTNGTVTAVAPPNAAGSESSHADQVGDTFYGRNNTSTPEGVAPGVSHVYNYEADYFINDIIVPGVQISARVVNQSFIDNNVSDATALDQAYDNYIAYYGTTVVSGAGNGGAVYSPATAYNGIGVAAYGGSSSTGPTQADTAGRSKPDITAPASATSYSTPMVSGAAAILIQAGSRGDGGADPTTENEATDSRTVKALLLNGAVKPVGWTHTSTAPLDPRYGAGIVNVYNSYTGLEGGKNAFSLSNTSRAPAAGSPALATLDGWDFNSLSSTASLAAVNHYVFDLSSRGPAAFNLVSTLVWNRQFEESGINNLFLYLYDVTTGQLVDSSVSTVDNVQELTDVGLAPDEYDLEVYKPSGTPGDPGTVSDGETYALAFDLAVPEPRTWVSFAVAMAGIAGFGLRKR